MSAEPPLGHGQQLLSLDHKRQVILIKESAKQKYRMQTYPRTCLALQMPRIVGMLPKHLVSTVGLALETVMLVLGNPAYLAWFGHAWIQMEF